MKNKEIQLKEMKDRLFYLSSRIGMMKIRRSMGQYESIKELKALEKEFGILGKKYMKVKQLVNTIQNDR